MATSSQSLRRSEEQRLAPHISGPPTEASHVGMQPRQAGSYPGQGPEWLTAKAARSGIPQDRARVPASTPVRLRIARQHGQHFASRQSAGGFDASIADIEAGCLFEQQQHPHAIGRIEAERIARQSQQQNFDISNGRSGRSSSRIVCQSRSDPSRSKEESRGLSAVRAARRL